jgi:hypothetical protein
MWQDFGPWDLSKSGEAARSSSDLVVPRFRLKPGGPGTLYVISDIVIGEK